MQHIWNRLFKTGRVKNWNVLNVVSSAENTSQWNVGYKIHCRAKLKMVALACFKRRKLGPLIIWNTPIGMCQITHWIVAMVWFYSTAMQFLGESKIGMCQIEHLIISAVWFRSVTMKFPGESKIGTCQMYDLETLPNLEFGGINASHF